MIETDRVLRPLREAEGAIDRLETYESPAVLTEALRATWLAVDCTLRTLLRSDASAPESVRLTAMSPEQLPADAVMTELRRRDLVTIGLAGRVHELRHAVERAASGNVRASDADNAQEVVRCLVDEVHGAARRAAAPSSEPGAGSGAIADTSASVLDAMNGSSERPVARRRFVLPPRPLLLAAFAGIVLIVSIVAVVLAGRTSELERGIAAFGDGRHAEAETHFRAALGEDSADNTARLYLARLLRSDGRRQEAAALLRAAVAQDPEDADVRRELGYLFLDLDRPEPAARQFRSAVEIDPEESLNWILLVESLRRAGDAESAAQWLRRAPADAQARLRGG